MFIVWSIFDIKIKVVELIKKTDVDVFEKTVKNIKNENNGNQNQNEIDQIMFTNDQNPILANQDNEKKAFINFHCSYIRIDPRSVFIQFPYLTRFLSIILFWGYFTLQTFCLEEVLSDTSLDGYKCFNVSKKLTGKLYRYLNLTFEC